MSANPLNSIESLETTMATAAHAQEKPKAKERRLTNKNVKQVYEKHDDIDDLLQDVLNVRSLATNGYALLCKRFLARPRSSVSAIVYEYVTHACTCVNKHHDVAQGRHSLVFDKLRSNAPSPYALLTSLIAPFVVTRLYLPWSNTVFTEAQNTEPAHVGPVRFASKILV